MSALLQTGFAASALAVVAGCTDRQSGDPAAFEGMSCQERADYAAGLMASAFLRDCTEDNDCVLVASGTDCYRGCDTPVSREGKAAVEAAKKKTFGPCRDFSRSGCAAAGPSCQVPTGAACSDGQCVALPRR